MFTGVEIHQKKCLQDLKFTKKKCLQELKELGA